LAGVRIAAGDLVVADDDGVVVLPSARIDEVLAAGKARA
jgi:4-hydroxy-4-methyl-2-oxoglutarate aldolase